MTLPFRQFLCCLGLSLTLTLTACGGGGGGGSSTAVANVSSGTAMGNTAAARLLMQGTFGASYAQVTSTGAQSYADWFSAQAAATPTHELPLVPNSNSDRQAPWWTIAVTANDQLRQRMAFALSEILVTSANNADLAFAGQALAHYYDQLVDNSLGNFRTVLDVVSHSPVMGHYLTYYKNVPGNAAIGSHADENYARELMQLFTVGLWQLNSDGTRQLDGSGNPIAAYSQADVSGLARVFTGWASAPVSHSGAAAWEYDNDLMDPMVCYSAYHDSTAKTIINSTAIGAGGTCDSEMKVALDTLFNHPNTGPFISRQLIQRLVTSNPSAAYVGRVAAVFANDGSGVRGNLLAVAAAILTDSEAVNAGTASTAGKLREPVLRITNLWRAFTALDNGNAIDDQIALNSIYDLHEASLDSPTVFNFFRPDYQLAGPLATAGMVAPEFQITNEFTLVQSVNDLEELSYQFIDSAGNQCDGPDGYSVSSSGSTVFLHTKDWESLASDPASLVDALNLTLMAGQMSSAMRQSLITYVSGIPLSPVSCYGSGSNGGSGPAVRVIDAVQLIINSSQYAIQR